MKIYEAVTSTYAPSCPHDNGWCVTIRFFFDLFYVRRFVCSDCGETLRVKVTK